MATNNPEDVGQNINCGTFHLGDHIHQHQHENQLNLTKNINVQRLQQNQQITYVDCRQIRVQQASLQIAASSAQRSLSGPHQQTGTEELTIDQGTETQNQPTNDDQNASVKSPFNSAIVKAVRSQKRNLQSDITLHGQLKVDVCNIPLVHPTYISTDFYRGLKPNQSEKFIPSTIKREKIQWGDKTVAFNDLLVLVYEKKFTALIGPAGCGKTTTSIRLVQATNDLVPFHLRFMDMDYKKELTVKQLLMDFLFPDLDTATKESAFSWMVNNPEKCVFIMDGYDQAVWSLENVTPVNASYDTPLTIQQLVANLCCKKFFSQSMLIFTSRPHAMISIPSELRPDVTIYIKDLSTDGMKKLFYAFAQDRSDELWEMLNTKAPQLFDLCHNPILLQFIIIAALCSSANDFESITTITGVFEAVLEHLRHSDYARGLDINRLWEPLGRMAYKGMKRKSVVFTIEDLKEEGLIDVDVQDLVIINARQLGFNQRLFDGDKIIYFIHQLLQEKFAAKYITSCMLDKEFVKVLQEIVYEHHWAMVRRFLCGLLLGKSKDKEMEENMKRDDIPSTSSDIAQSRPQTVDETTPNLQEGLTKKSWLGKMRTRFSKRKKKNKPTSSSIGRSSLFLNKMLKLMQETIQERSKDNLAEVFVDLLEVSDEIFNKFVTAIPDNVEFDDEVAKSVIRVHAFNRVLLKLDKSIGAINFKTITDDKVISRFLSALKETKCTIKLLHLVGNLTFGRQLELILPHVERSDEIHLYDCGINDVSKLSNQMRKRKSKLTYLDLTSNPIGNVGLQHLAQCVCYIQKMSVGRCGITDLQALTASILKEQCLLSRLLLFNNRIGNTGLQHLASCVRYIQELDLSTCGITDVEGLTSAILQEKCNFTCLNLSSNAIGNLGLQHLALCVRYVHKLCLRECGITDLQALIEPMLQQQSKTVELNVSFNKIFDEGINQLALFIHKLELLGVNSCGVTDVTYLCKAIANRNTKMKYLDLIENDLGLNGAVSISGCLDKIGTLSVTYNDITDKGIEHLEQAYWDIMIFMKAKHLWQLDCIQ